MEITTPVPGGDQGTLGPALCWCCLWPLLAQLDSVTFRDTARSQGVTFGAKKEVLCLGSSRLLSFLMLSAASISHGSQGKGEVTMPAFAFLTAPILSPAAAASSHQLPRLASLHRAKEGTSSRPGTSQNVHLADNPLPCSEPNVGGDFVPKLEHRFYCPVTVTVFG